MRRARLAGIAVLAAAAGGVAWAVVAEDRRELPAIVAVSVARATGPAEVATGFGSGAGRVVTVAHVLEGGGTVTVRGPDGVRHLAQVLRADRRLDLAVLDVDGLRAAAPRFAGGAGDGRLLVRRGGRVRVLPSVVRRRITARVHRAARVDARPALELSADVAAGDSGAPLVSPGGDVAGVVFARSRGRARTAYAVDDAALGGFMAGAPRVAAR